jgi:hypothetical protein
VQRETARSNASVLPYERGSSWSPDIWCKEGDLLKRTRKGKFRFQNTHPPATETWSIIIIIIIKLRRRVPFLMMQGVCTG